MKKTRIIVFAVIIISVISIAFLFLFEAQQEARRAAAENVAVINLRGTIADGAGSLLGPQGVTPEYVANQLEKAEEDISVKAVVLRVDSPGGSVASSQEIADLIKSSSQTIVVSMGDIAASGGYYISARADAIVAQPGTITGSIGVITTLINPEGLYEKLGLDVEVIKSGRHKDMMQRSLTEEERELLQDLSDEAYNQFINEIAEGRDKDVEEVREVATGELFLGSKAKRLGLVDELGGVNEAVKLAGEIEGLDDPQEYRFPDPTFFEILTGFALEFSDIFRNMFMPEDILKLELLEEKLYPEIQYKYK